MTVTLEVAQSWLIHPGIPDLSCPIDGIVLGDETQDINQGVNVILGRADPIVITDGVRHSDVFTLTLKTQTAVELAALKALLADGTTLLLQMAYGYTESTKYAWVSVGALTRSRRTNNFGDARRLWTLPCTVTRAPAGLLQSQFTWADLIAQESSWANTLNDFDTWRDVVTNSTGS